MKPFKNKLNQTGAALAMGMMLLLVVSVIGITSMKSALLEDKMASGLKNRELSDAAALTLLVAAEHWLFSYFKQSNGTALTSSCSFCLETRSSDAHLFRTEKSLNGGFEHPTLNINDLFGGVLAAEPKFIIESISDISVAEGGNGNNYGESGGEEQGGSAGGVSGNSENTPTPESYRVVSKATDSTGHSYSGYESVFSIVVN